MNRLSRPNRRADESGGGQPQGERDGPPATGGQFHARRRVSLSAGRAPTRGALELCSDTQDHNARPVELLEQGVDLVSEQDRLGQLSPLILSDRDLLRDPPA